MANKLLLLGNGDHCKSILDTILDLNVYDEIGIISKNEVCEDYLGIKCVGVDDDLQNLFFYGWNNAFVAIGGTEISEVKRELFEKISIIGFNIPNIIDKTAIVSRNAVFGKGVFVGKGAIINAGVMIDDCAIVNTGSVIEHNCNIGKYTHVAPNCTLCGGVKIKDNCHIGAGSVIKQYLSVGNHSIIGIGSVVTKNISNNVVAYGNPCKEIYII